MGAAAAKDARLVVTQAGEQLALDSHSCTGNLARCRFVRAYGVSVVNLGEVPHGLDTTELESYLRVHAAEICNPGARAALMAGWPEEPASALQKAYMQARRAAYSQSVARLQQGATAAATTLPKVMVDPGTPASVRVRAAECVMNHSSKAIEIEDVEARVADLERAAEAAKRGGS